MKKNRPKTQRTTLGSKTPRKNVGLPPISKYPTRKEWEAASWRILVSRKDRLHLLLTAYERRHLILRAAALDLLMAGKSYRTIGKELWLSPQTISGIKKAFQEQSYRSYTERSKTERKKKEYSPFPARAHRDGRPHRTKYGTTIYLPY